MSFHLNSDSKGEEEGENEALFELYKKKPINFLISIHNGNKTLMPNSRDYIYTLGRIKIAIIN